LGESSGRKSVKQSPLPNSDKPCSKSGIRSNFSSNPQIAKELLQFLSTEDKSVILSVAMQIKMPNENERMHPRIIAHRKKVVEWRREHQKSNQHFNNRNKKIAPFLADTISETGLPRVCRIIDALIKAMEPLGCELTEDLQFIINGETVDIYITESKDKVDHVMTREENMRMLEYEENKRKYSWASKPNIRKYDYIYNGKISFLIGSEKSFRDCKSYVIENRLGDMLVLLYEASETARIEREKKEDAERKRLEEERAKEQRRKRYNLEVERTIALVNESEDYNTACQIRAYISSIKQKDDLSKEETEWISWAELKADWYDPVISRNDEFLGLRKHCEDQSSKKLKTSYSSWGW
jgi:hypothetical protein